MEKTKIDWADATWNPVTGCYHLCEYCYARRIAERFQPYGLSHDVEGAILRPINELEAPIKTVQGDGKERVCAFPYGFEPTFHRYRLNDYAAKKGRNIFVCSVADLFGKWVPTRWIAEVMDACEAGQQHNYMFLTKNPERYMQLDHLALLPRESNFWYGSTVTTEYSSYFHSDKHKTFLSIEPLLGRLGPFRQALDGVDWVIIGAMTGPKGKDHQPELEWVEEIVETCRFANIPVFMKQNLSGVWGDDLIQEWPAELRKGRGNE